MAYTKRIVCLAISYRPDGRCIAGMEVLGNGEFGGWIRPISARDSAGVPYEEYRYRSGDSPKLLDIIDVPLLRAAPHSHQTENHILDPESRWVKRGELAWDDLEQMYERPESIWVNSDRTRVGCYDCMSAAEAARLRNSLLLVKKKAFTVVVGSSTWDGVTRRIYRGQFDYRGTHHNFSLTDPAALRAFSAKQEGDYPLNDVYVCVSLTEPYKEDGRCHKLVAAVLRNPPL
jgi:hypothetical protein